MTTRRTMRTSPFPALAALVAVLVVSGCLGTARDAGPMPGAAIVGIDVPPVDFGHDHTDAALHSGVALGIRELGSVVFEEGAFSREVLGQVEVGTGGRMTRVGDLLFVTFSREAGDGSGRYQGGFTVLDVSEPRAPVRLGTYRSEYGASEGEGLAVTPDARFAFVAIETAFSFPPVPPAIEVVDLRDPAHPSLARRIPWTANPHLFAFVESGDAEFLVVSDYQPDNLPAYVLDSGGERTNRIALWRFDRSALSLEPAARYTFGDREKSDGVYFPHDPWPMRHPVTDEHLLYLGAFAGGGRILSLSGDLQATRELSEVGFTLDRGSAPVLRHHSFDPAPVVVDGVLPTAAVPRSRAEDGAAFVTLYDTIDPTRPVRLGEWRHPDEFPPGDLPALNLHVPLFTSDGSRMLVPHYHAGLVVFDSSSRAAMENLVPVAYWAPSGADAQPGAPYVNSVIMAMEVGNVILATDRSAGRLYVLELLV
ncbi:MAG: LVIVD repeat-containing protein [Methanobacteriota archaeon]